MDFAVQFIIYIHHIMEYLAELFLSILISQKKKQLKFLLHLYACKFCTYYSPDVRTNGVFPKWSRTVIGFSDFIEFRE